MFGSLMLLVPWDLVPLGPQSLSVCRLGPCPLGEVGCGGEGPVPWTASLTPTMVPNHIIFYIRSISKRFGLHR